MIKNMKMSLSMLGLDCNIKGVRIHSTGPSFAFFGSASKPFTIIGFDKKNKIFFLRMGELVFRVDPNLLEL